MDRTAHVQFDPRLEDAPWTRRSGATGQRPSFAVILSSLLTLSAPLPCPLLSPIEAPQPRGLVIRSPWDANICSGRAHLYS
eukprot:4999651-Pyramimonas_sp.AAC.1